MNCTRCDYLLFNLREPVCPECGQGFDLAMYRFEPGHVAFVCPHCAQEYYGNDQQGLPYPRSFTCVSCAQPLTLQQLSVSPKHEQARGALSEVSPWDERHSRGSLRAWWDTWKMILVKPGKFFRAFRGRSYKEAWLFSTIAMYIGLVPYLAMSSLFLWGVNTIIKAAPGGPPAPFGPAQLTAILITYAVMAVVVPPIAPIVNGALWACLIHPVLWLLAPRRRSMGDTMQMTMYAMGPYALTAIPICGAWASGVWCLVALVQGVKEVHQTTGTRASIAVLWPVVAVIGIYFIAIALFLSSGGFVFPAPVPAPGGAP